MKLRSSTTKAFAAFTAAGLLTLGGASAAFAAGGSAGSGSGSGRAATAAREHPRALRNVLRAAATAAATELGMTTEELRAAVMEGPQSVGSVAGDQAGAVTAAVEAALGGLVDTAEADGSITAEQAAKLRERVPTAAERFVNKVPGTRGGTA